MSSSRKLVPFHVNESIDKWWLSMRTESDTTLKWTPRSKKLRNKFYEFLPKNEDVSISSTKYTWLEQVNIRFSFFLSKCWAVHFFFYSITWTFFVQCCSVIVWFDDDFQVQWAQQCAKAFKTQTSLYFCACHFQQWPNHLWRGCRSGHSTRTPCTISINQSRQDTYTACLFFLSNIVALQSIRRCIDRWRKKNRRMNTYWKIQFICDKMTIMNDTFILVSEITADR